MARAPVENRGMIDHIIDVVNTEAADTFYEAARDRTEQAENSLKDLAQEFFPEMASVVGSNETPEKVSYIQGDWSDLSFSWMERKKSNYENRYYWGQTGRFKAILATINAVERYGKPYVVVTQGDEIEGKAPATFDPKVQRNRLPSGRFAPTKGIQIYYKASVAYRLFPAVESGAGSMDMFINRLPTNKAGSRKKGGSKTFRELAAYGEYGTSSGKRPARPFFGPFLEYYITEKARTAVQQALR